MLVPLVVVTGLAEGAGLLFLAAPLHGMVTMPLLGFFVVLASVRVIAWLEYRRRLAGKTAAEASASLDRAGRVLLIAGSLVPLALAAAMAAGLVTGGWRLPVASAAGLLAAVAGGHFKFTLVTRAGFNQGFALPHLPVHGTRA
jgi:phenylacetyl-CoA:acceptor oxidoreductase subunit 2